MEISDASETATIAATTIPTPMISSTATMTISAKMARPGDPMLKTLLILSYMWRGHYDYTITSFA